MLRQKLAAAFLLSAFILPNAALAQQPAVQPASDAVAKFKDEGMNRSQAMATMRYLTDVIGARLTNSPAQRRANNWTKEQLTKWGIQNAAVEAWGEFGRGWELKRFSASIVAPEFAPFRAYPKAWSPSTNGAVTGDVVIVDATDEAGLEKYKGKLKGAIVLLSQPAVIKPGFEPVASRVSDTDLQKLSESDGKPPVPRQPTPEELEKQKKDAETAKFNTRKFRFYHEEGAAVLIEPSFRTDSGTIRVMGASVPQPVAADAANPPAAPRVYDKSAPAIVPQIVAEVEQYNRLFRQVKDGTATRMTVDLDVKFHADDLNGYNTIAEIPGTDLKDEVVMIGAHLDSWHAAAGATDNAAGVTVVMEAMRILQASGFKPRRTIRVALWTGEEQGLLGSRGYIANNFAALSARPRQAGGSQEPRTVTKKAGYDKFAAYYNLDNGTGRIRGVYMQGNEQLRPIFREWLAPFKEMGASTLTVSGTGGSDHQAFDEVNLPGFQFIQDPIEYFARTWHTTQDVYDRIIEDDLKQSAVIMATFAYNSAMSNEKLPRKTNPNLNIASVLSGFNLQAMFDERKFHASNLNFSVCGHQLNVDEIEQTGFPGILTVGANYAHLGD